LLEGCYVAFGHSLFPFHDTEQVKEVVQGMDIKMGESNKLKVLILRAMRQLTFLPVTLSTSLRLSNNSYKHKRLLRRNMRLLLQLILLLLGLNKVT